LAALLLASFAVEIPESINSGTVTGTVLDPTRMVIPKAFVEIRNLGTGFAQTVTTKGSGAFRFDTLPPNMYEIVISASGFAIQHVLLEIRGRFRLA
jgi:hypothetical protein